MVWGSHFKGCVSTQGGSSSSRSICWGVRKCGTTSITKLLDNSGTVVQAFAVCTLKNCDNCGKHSGQAVCASKWEFRIDSFFLRYSTTCVEWQVHQLHSCQSQGIKGYTGLVFHFEFISKRVQQALPMTSMDWRGMRRMGLSIPTSAFSSPYAFNGTGTNQIIYAY